jgi:uncharacterized membrane protein (DUF106 family)
MIQLMIAHSVMEMKKLSRVPMFETFSCLIVICAWLSGIVEEDNEQLHDWALFF